MFAYGRSFNPKKSASIAVTVMPPGNGGGVSMPVVRTMFNDDHYGAFHRSGSRSFMELVANRVCAGNDRVSHSCAMSNLLLTGYALVMIV